MVDACPRTVTDTITGVPNTLNGHVRVSQPHSTGETTKAPHRLVAGCRRNGTVFLKDLFPHPVNSNTLVSLFVTTLRPTVRDAESLTHCFPTTYRDPLCANCYFLRSSRGALAPGANSKVPAIYQ
jgi:hypothetical protein